MIGKVDGLNVRLGRKAASRAAAGVFRRDSPRNHTRVLLNEKTCLQGLEITATLLVPAPTTGPRPAGRNKRSLST